MTVMTEPLLTDGEQANTWSTVVEVARAEQANTWSTVVDVVLRRDPLEGTWTLIVYNADESEASIFELNAVSYRAAALEATALIKDLGFEPAERWSNEEDGRGEEVEGIRKFRRAPRTDDNEAASEDHAAAIAVIQEAASVNLDGAIAKIGYDAVIDRLVELGMSSRSTWELRLPRPT
jgi:hypothetical protein